MEKDLYELKQFVSKQLLENEIDECEQYLSERLGPDQMILDGWVIDENTFEDIRELTEEERECFYLIRINKMKLRRLEEK